MAAQFESPGCYFQTIFMERVCWGVEGTVPRHSNVRSTALSSKRSQVPASGVFDKSAGHFALYSTQGGRTRGTELSGFFISDLGKPTFSWLVGECIRLFPKQSSNYFS